MQYFEFGPNDLWSGCMYATIAHALAIAKNPEIASFQSWDGQSYLVRDLEGSHGAITFMNGMVAAAFFDLASEDGDLAGIEAFAAAPSAIQNLAQHEALQYMIQERDGRESAPCTGAFWNEGLRLRGSTDWDSTLERGAHLIARQASGVGNVELWAAALGLTADELDLSIDLFLERSLSHRAPVTLGDALASRVRTTAGDQGDEVLRHLSQAGIVL